MSISTDTTERVAPSVSWPRRYLRDHVAHAFVALGFAGYPVLYWFLTDALGLYAAAFLPSLDTMVVILILGLFAVSFDFVSGYTGYLSFGHAAFFGTGAYFVILAVNGKIPLVPTDLHFVFLMLLAALVATALAVAIGLVSFRLTGVYFAMITLGFAEVMFVIAENWDYLTVGASHPRDGINSQGHLFELGIPGLDWGNFEIHQSFGDTLTIVLAGTELVTIGGRLLSFYLIAIVVLLCYLAMQRIVHSPFGRVMIAIRENEERARAIGYDTFRYKLGAFAISAFFGAVAGALWGAYNTAADPTDSFFFLVTGFALIAAIIGGLGTLAGPLFGYLFLESVNEFLSPAGQGGGLQPLLSEMLPDAVLAASVSGFSVRDALGAFVTGHGEFYAGIIFIVFVLYLPGGIIGTLRERYGAPIATVVSRRIARGSDGSGE